MEEKKETGKGLNEKQLLFCRNYVSKAFFANGVEAYAEAYNLDLEEKGGYASAKTGAWRLLTNVDILEHIDSLLELSGLSDQFVDKQLLFVITQHADMPSKISGIREYNKLKGRITEKRETTKKVIRVKVPGE